MRFVINQKLLSIAGKYFIKDELGNDAFVVKGNFASVNKGTLYCSRSDIRTVSFNRH